MQPIKEASVEGQESLISNNESQKSFMQRTFGQMEQGSLRLAILTLINTAIGAGMLALPSSIAQFGYIIGFLLFFVASGNLYLGLYCFKYFMFKYDAKIYTELVKEILGSKFESILNFIFISYVFCALIAYILVSEKLLWQVLKVFIKESQQAIFENLLFLLLLILSCIANLAKSVDELKIFSKFSLGILLYIALVLLYQTPAYLEEMEPTYSKFQFSLDGWISGYGCYIYSFNCIVNVFLVKTTLKRTSKPRIKKIFNRTILFIVIFYLVVGFCGYISLGDNVKQYDLILQRPALKDSSDILMRIGLGLFGFQMFIGYVVHVIPIKSQLYGHFKFEDNNKNNIIISWTITLLSMGIAYFYPHAKKIFSLIGSFFGTTVVCTIPGLMMCKYLWDNSQQYSLKSVLFHSWTIIFSTLGYLCSFYILIHLFKGEQFHQCYYLKLFIFQ